MKIISKTLAAAIVIASSIGALTLTASAGNTMNAPERYTASAIGAPQGQAPRFNDIKARYPRTTAASDENGYYFN